MGLGRVLALKNARESLKTLGESIRPTVSGARGASGGGGIIAAAQHLEGTIREVIMRTFQGRTGQLARSFKTEFVQLPDGTVTARVASRLVYAGIQDEGGTIYPRRAKKLAVPIGAGAHLPVGTYARDVPGLTLIKSKSGNSILAKVSRGRGGVRDIKAYFVLKDSVRLRGRQYLAKAEAEARPGIERILGDSLNTMIKREWTK